VQNAVANSALAGMADVQAETGTKPWATQLALA
jgi:hypothetical protein